MVKWFIEIGLNYADTSSFKKLDWQICCYWYMHRNVVRVLQKFASTTILFFFGLNTLKLNFYFLTLTPSSLLPRAGFRKRILSKICIYWFLTDHHTLVTASQHGCQEPAHQRYIEATAVWRDQTNYLASIWSSTILLEWERRGCLVRNWLKMIRLWLW